MSTKKGGRGTHGSISKAGKVRMQTPKIEKSVKHKPSCPRVAKKMNYEKRILMERKSGQNWESDLGRESSRRRRNW